MIIHECQNCGRGTRNPLPVQDVFERVAPGEPMPSGECPECGALTHEVLPTTGPKWKCSQCGGHNVQHALWVRLNDWEPDKGPNSFGCEDAFGSWCNGGNSWCEDCDDHTHITLVEGS